jgi:hypothetical protein
VEDISPISIVMGDHHGPGNCEVSVVCSKGYVCVVVYLYVLVSIGNLHVVTSGSWLGGLDVIFLWEAALFHGRVTVDCCVMGMTGYIRDDAVNDSLIEV